MHAIVETKSVNLVIQKFVHSEQISRALVSYRKSCRMVLLHEFLEVGNSRVFGIIFWPDMTSNGFSNHTKDISLVKVYPKGTNMLYGWGSIYHAEG